VWSKKNFKVDILSSLHQRIDVGTTHLLVLGLDAEILLRRNGRTLWPHQQKCPQERVESKWKDPSARFDWHGDGYAFELCTEATHCLDVLMRLVGKGFKYLNDKYETPMRMATPTLYKVPAAVVRSAPEEVGRLGCAPSFNVYDDAGVPSMLGDQDRTTGCHMHVSHPWLDNAKAKTAVKWADILVGNAWNYISPEDPKVEAYRRQAYGRAGEHRRNIYPNGVFGFEYRVLPGRVLSHPAYLTLMFSLLRSAVVASKLYGDPHAKMQAAARAAINGADKKLSAAILSKQKLSQATMQMLAYLSKRPLPTLTMGSWAKMGQSCRGHMNLYWNLRHAGKVL